MACFGKALGNGMPISAVVGKRELMQAYEEVFVSGTFGGETLSLAAAIAVIDKIKSRPVIETLWQTGKNLGDSVHQAITAQGLEKIISISGYPPMQSLAFFDHPNASADEIKTLFVCLMLEHGVLTIGNHNMMYAHSSSDMDFVLKAYNTVLDRIDNELKRPGLAQR
ncbi:MAG: aminotransferase class III-fold pyridoxal phosphate-dependent enzyme, partial [Gammaproteobacteria bacterium]|nr:aminotransferase class III-fold pyridoxal phosphate-dependent enzyme [Gammaproteobacteria bacterium]NIO62998.1 aminotransferase class III-fold pyridoxal phosphate-dependent enzyme [Gammaproteobacteria bacterium]